MTLLFTLFISTLENFHPHIGFVLASADCYNIFASVSQRRENTNQEESMNNNK
jgi:hypothetical protein